MDAPVVCRRRGQSYTCIRVAVGRKFTYYIPMDSLGLKKADNREFHDEWEEFPEYPVRRAAELYLGATQYREMSPKAQEHLERIVADPATPYDPARIIPLKEEPQMTDVKKTAPAKQPATSKVAAAKQPATSKVAAAKQPATSKVAAAKQPATSKVAAAKQAEAKPLAPAKKAPAKAARSMYFMVNEVMKAGAKRAAAAGAKPAKAAAKAPAKQAAPAKAEPKAKGGTARKPDDRKYTVGDDSSIKRGISRDFVDTAKRLKKFTRADLVEAFKDKADEEHTVRYVYYFVGKQVFVPA